MAAFDYDVFISYSRQDNPWAVKLEEGLLAQAINDNRIFRDVTRITAGDNWNEDLKGALMRSRHLIVLWSKNARESAWVTNEVYKYDSYIDLQKSGQIQGDRKLILISLDEQNISVANYQAINELFVNGDYAKGIGNLNPNVWSQVMRSVARAINSGANLPSIALAVVAMTKDRVDELNFNDLLPSKPGEQGETLGQILNGIGIKSKEDLTPYYGAKALDWQPFRSPKTKIITIMTDVQEEFNEVMRQNKKPAKQFKWEIVGDYWSETKQATIEYNKLRMGKAVIVIDPLSLYITNFSYERFHSLFECFRNKSALFMVFAPFVLPAPIGALRRLVNARAQQIFKYFYEPNITDDGTYAICGADVGDEADIKRWLLTALKPQPETQSLPSESPAAPILNPPLS